jgi:hypothetical protein
LAAAVYRYSDGRTKMRPRYTRQLLLLGLLGLCVLFGVRPVAAQVSLVGTEASTGAVLGDTIADNLYLLGQQFTVTTGSWSVTSIELLLQDVGRDADIMLFTDSGGLPDTFLGADDLASYTPLGGGFEVATFTNMEVALTPGTYWLILGAMEPSNSGSLEWVYVDNALGGAGINSGVAGVAENLYIRSVDNGATWDTVGSLGTTEYYYFTIQGAAAPEPTTLVLLSLGGTLVILRRRNRA